MNISYRSPSKLSNRRSWDFTQRADLTLYVEEKEFFVHRGILCKYSPVFQVMLESDNFREKNSQIINLPNKRADDVQQMLNFIYPFGHQITGTNSFVFLTPNFN